MKMKTRRNRRRSYQRKLWNERREEMSVSVKAIEIVSKKEVCQWRNEENYRRNIVNNRRNWNERRRNIENEI